LIKQLYLLPSALADYLFSFALADFYLLPIFRIYLYLISGFSRIAIGLKPFYSQIIFVGPLLKSNENCFSSSAVLNQI